MIYPRPSPGEFVLIGRFRDRAGGKAPGSTGCSSVFPPSSLTSSTSISPSDGWPLFLASVNTALSSGRAIRARNLAVPSHNGAPSDLASARSSFSHCSWHSSLSLAHTLSIEHQRRRVPDLYCENSGQDVRGHFPFAFRATSIAFQSSLLQVFGMQTLIR